MPVRKPWRETFAKEAGLVKEARGLRVCLLEDDPLSGIKWKSHEHGVLVCADLCSILTPAFLRLLSARCPTSLQSFPGSDRNDNKSSISSIEKPNSCASRMKRIQPMVARV